MRATVAAIGGLMLGVALSIAAPPAAAQSVAVPQELEGWREWALAGQEFRACPFLAGSMPGEPAAHRCAWPQRLALEVGGAGARFAQRWQVFAESWIVLPGGPEHWPQDVTADGAPIAVVEREGQPQVRLAPGEHALEGRFVWATRPESLAVAPQTALVDLTVDGERIAQPERPGGAVSFGRRRAADQPQQLEVQVYRLVRDDVPVRLLTRIRLQVAGEAREELLARVLPEGFTPLVLGSALPARLEADGRLRVQLRPGNYEIDLVARGPGVLDRLARPAPTPGAPWAREEIWSFEGVDRLRVVSPQGPEQVDPAQTNVPPEWQNLPAFRMTPEAVLQASETSRGLSQADGNRLRLSRELWLDFDHAGYTAVDRITGSMRQGWRLDAAAPLRLESARIGEETLLVTQGAGEGVRGVELRAPQVGVLAVSRLEPARGTVPATGWQAEFDGVDGTLYLPPGHRLLAAIGPDAAPGTWWSGWALWNLFGVFIVVVFTYRLAGVVPAAVALAALTLTYQESPGYIWLWANLLLALGVARYAPEGRLRGFARRYRLASFAVLGLALLPLAWGQIRLAIYPQLALPSVGVADVAGVAGVADVMEEVEVTAARTLATPPPAPEVALSVEAAPEADTKSQSARIVLDGTRVVQRYAPGTPLQAGPGVPNWRYSSYAYSWSGPVDANATATFVYLGPAGLALWRLAGVLMLVLWFAILVQQSLAARPPGTTLADLLRRRGGASAAGGATTASGASSLVLALAVGAGAAALPSPAMAASTPDPQLLGELRQRLLAPPRCAPNCADISTARVSIDGDRLEVRLTVNALALVAVPVPSASDRWQLEEVSVDGASSLAVSRDASGALGVPVRPGVREVRLVGRVARVASVQLAFPLPPRRVAVEAEGWDVVGLNDGRLLAGSLEFTRRAGVAVAAAADGRRAGQGVGFEANAEFPPFVEVRREFAFDVVWTVTTTLTRIAPASAALAVRVPLVPGEAVLSENVEVKDGAVLAGLAAGEFSRGWSSVLTPGEALALNLPAAVDRTEIWAFAVGPQWRVEFEGVPAVLPDEPDGETWIFRFVPRPGESLKLRIARPAAAEGRTLAIDGVRHRISFGERQARADLQFDYRSTQGGRHSIRLPDGARVTAVTLDGQPVQVRPENGELSIGLLPGRHSVSVVWDAPGGSGLLATPGALDLRAPASNVSTQMDLAPDRWPLVALSRGAGVGPAILYWGELVAFLLTAWLLGRWAFSPLRSWEWLLLGLGLSTLSWTVFAIVAAWLFAMRWRERAGAAPARDDEATALWFNARQIGLALLTLIAVSSLVFSGIRYGFFSTPDMGVAGPGSGGGTFAWFRDQTDAVLPQPLVVSVPMWVYKALIFAWSLWVAFALARWLRWSWDAWTSGGLWRGGKVATTAKG